MLARTKKVQHVDKLDSTTIRDFDGGWNVIDNDLSMKVKYARRLDNMIRKDDGSLGVRWGTKEFVAIPIEGVDTDVLTGALAGEWIINMEYFQDYLVVVTSRGAIYAVNAAGIIREIWPFITQSGGNWVNDLEVSYGKTYIDTGDASVWWSRRASTSSTSPAGTFAAERAANPTWWGATTTFMHPEWENEAGYSIGDTVIDPDTGTEWQCDIANTSTITITMAAERAANPTWWVTRNVLDGWHETDFASFAAFHDHMLIGNGLDKPLVVNFLQVTGQRCDWLVDLGTGSNANTPVAKYVLAMNDYVMWAGDVADPDMLYVSSTGTSGTYVSDPAPNDAVNISVAKKVSTNHPEIKGLARYRDNVIIAFEEKLAVGTPGTFVNEGTPEVPIMVHDLAIDDAIEAHGSLSHRSMVFLGDDLFMCDAVGVPSVASSVFKETLTPERPSELIDPELQRNIRELTQGVSEKNIFAVYNLLEKEYMLFLPNHNANVHTLDDPALVIVDFADNLIFVHSYDHNVIEGDTVVIQDSTAFNNIITSDLDGQHTVINIIDGDYFVIQLPASVVLDPNGDPQPAVLGAMTITSIRTESLGYVLSHRKAGKSIKAWSRFRGWNWTCGCRSLLGNLFFADYTKIYNYGNKQNELYGDFISPTDITDEGTAIDWIWDTPWSAMKERMNTKKMRYIGFDTRGNASFGVHMYVDDIYKDRYGYQDPALEMEFYGGDQGGYGAGQQAFGGGRPTNHERLYAWTTKGKLFKLRLYGSTTKPLRIIAILLAFLRGSIRR